MFNFFTDWELEAFSKKPAMDCIFLCCSVFLLFCIFIFLYFCFL